MPHHGLAQSILPEVAARVVLSEGDENWELHCLTCELWVRREAVPEVSSFLTPGNYFMDAGIYSQKHCVSDVPD